MTKMEMASAMTMKFQGAPIQTLVISTLLQQMMTVLAFTPTVYVKLVKMGKLLTMTKMKMASVMMMKFQGAPIQTLVILTLN